MLTEPFVYSGLKKVVVYELNAMGRPKATGHTAYVGIELYGSKAYNLTLPSTRKIAHTGNDRLLKVQQFPSLEVASGEISVGAEDLDVIAALSGSTIVTKAGFKMLPHLSDLAGSEPNVGLICMQSGLAKSGPYRTHFHFITSTKAVVRLPGAGAEPIDLVYDIAPDPVTRYLWGEIMAPLADIYDETSGVPESGAFEAGVWSGFAEGDPRIASFIAGAGQTLFEFPASMPANSAANIAVYVADPTDVYSVEVDAADYTATTAGVTFDVAPGTGKEVHIVFQEAV
jgi:hypothetical protein